MNEKGGGGDSQDLCGRKKRVTLSVYKTGMCVRERGKNEAKQKFKVKMTQVLEFAFLGNWNLITIRRIYVCNHE